MFVKPKLELKNPRSHEKGRGSFWCPEKRFGIFLTFKLSTTGFDFASILVLELGVVSNDWVYAHFADVGILIYDI